MFLLLFGGELAVQAADLELVLQPQALFGVRHVRELGADGAAVDVFELRDDVAQLEPRRELGRARAGEEFGVEIGIGQAEVAELEHARALRASAARADRGWRSGARGWRRSGSGARPRPAWPPTSPPGATAPAAPAAAWPRAAAMPAWTAEWICSAPAPSPQLLKVVAPLGVDTLRVGEELLIKSFDVRSVAARQRRGSQQLAKACGHTRKNPVDSRSWSDKGAVC